jgi:3-phenylpropionate/cinnamic acid dioxygenase small subunit
LAVLEAIDIVLIHQLVGRYGHLIDHRRWDQFAELFLPDATIDYRGGTGDVERIGRDAIVAWFRGLEDTHPPAHHVTNIVVDEAADPNGRVDVHSKFLAPFTRAGHVPKRLYGGEYHDVVVKTGEGWRFAHKQCIPMWQLAVVADDTAPEHRLTY